MQTDILLLSQEETHPFYSGVNSYFLAPLLAPPALPLKKFSAAPPLGITLLASALRREGFTALPLYNFFSREKEKERLLEELEKKPFAAGLSTTHTFRPETLRAAAELVKKISPKTVLIAGGPGAEWNEDLRPAGGYTALGPGEGALTELLRALRAGADPAGVANLILPDGKPSPGARRPPPQLESLPFPDWGLYPAAPRGVAVQGSRGCSRACGFCSYSAPYDARSAASVLAELRRNRNLWGIRRFRFTDSDFAGDPARALEICRGLEEDGGFAWTCFARADSLLRPGLAPALRRAGCQWVFLGVESGSDEMLRAMDKGCGAEAMRAGIAAAKSAGLGTHGNFVVGYPGETRATLAETLAFVKGAGLDTVYFSPFQIRSPGIPALARAQGGLSGGREGWSHATMSSGEMLKYAREIGEEISSDPGAPLLGSEALFSLFSEGEGEAYRANVLEFFGAFRRWHAGRRSGNGAELALARKTMEKHL